MKRELAMVLAAILLAVALPTAAQTTPADSLALLDSALADPYTDVELAVMTLGADLTDLAARDKLATAAGDALLALDAVGSRPCMAEWHGVARMAFWLLARSVELLYLADEYAFNQDLDGRDQAMAEFAMTATGYSLLSYAKFLRERTTCSPKPSAVPSPTPKRTVTPIQSEEP